ncbi:MAG: pyrroline-5-carboxylate reductase [Desulfurococcales archaeon]|nr:pyrroline-5-carboxylate reductase [Desulfurococcales archaeon]MCE4605048.1 pyrroline-5-carboxylate reductase [Desulfurococcales archaeon]
MCVFQEILGDKTIAILGAGKIGAAMIRSLRGVAGTIVATGRRDETLSKAEELGAVALKDNARAASMADIIIVSVKPYQLPVVVRDIMGHVNGKIVVSVVAGVRRDTIAKRLPGAIVFRAMPNINALIGMSTTAIVEGDYSPEHRLLVEAVFRSMGTIYWIPEEWIDTWTGLVGSGPAYLAEIIDGLVLGAVSMGLPRDVVYKAVLDTFKATAELLARNGKHPAVIRDEVTTPAGTTIHGLKVLESRGVKSALMDIVEASSRRGRELGKEIDAAVDNALSGG